MTVTVVITVIVAAMVMTVVIRSRSFYCFFERCDFESFGYAIGGQNLLAFKHENLFGQLFDFEQFLNNRNIFENHFNQTGFDFDNVFAIGCFFKHDLTLNTDECGRNLCRFRLCSWYRLCILSKSDTIEHQNNQKTEQKFLHTILLNLCNFVAHHVLTDH